MLGEESGTALSIGMGRAQTLSREVSASDTSCLTWQAEHCNRSLGARSGEGIDCDQNSLNICRAVPMLQAVFYILMTHSHN